MRFLLISRSYYAVFTIFHQNLVLHGCVSLSFALFFPPFLRHSFITSLLSSSPRTCSLHNNATDALRLAIRRSKILSSFFFFFLSTRVLHYGMRCVPERFTHLLTYVKHTNYHVMIFIFINFPRVFIRRTVVRSGISASAPLTRIPFPSLAFYPINLEPVCEFCNFFRDSDSNE